VSPFFGGGSFEFHLQKEYGLHIVANDKFEPLYTFWNICRFNKDELCTKLLEYLDKVDKNLFTEMREKVMLERDPLLKSCMYFIINRCSFSGATLSGGFSPEASKKRFTKSSIERIKKLDMSSNFEIYNCDFEDFLEEKGCVGDYDANPLLFLDPPYYLEKNSKLYGKNGDMHEHFDHDKLFKCLSTRKKWIMTYNDCAYIRNLYKDYTIIEASWSYGMNKTKESSEIVIINNQS
jgi:DNA adenine methylase